MDNRQIRKQQFNMRAAMIEFSIIKVVRARQLQGQMMTQPDLTTEMTNAEQNKQSTSTEREDTDL